MGSGQAGLRQSRPKKPEKRKSLFELLRKRRQYPTLPSSHVNKNISLGMVSLGVMGNQPQFEANAVDAKVERQECWAVEFTNLK